MSAAILLHGLFLLVCHSDRTCDLIAPHTRMNGAGNDMHQYRYYGTPPAGGPAAWNALDTQVDFTKPMSVGLGDLTPAFTHPFDFVYEDGGPYLTHEFLLDSNKLAVKHDSRYERNVIRLPWPDQIRAANRVSVAATDVADSANQALVNSLKDIGGDYLFAETTVLYYRNGLNFTLLNSEGKPVARSAGVNGDWIMAFASWPPVGSHLGDHTFDLNHLLELKQKPGTYAQLKLTGIEKMSCVGNEDEFNQIGLPISLTASPTPCRGTVLNTDAKGVRTITRFHAGVNRTGTETGCPLVSLDDR